MFPSTPELGPVVKTRNTARSKPRNLVQSGSKCYSTKSNFRLYEKPPKAEFPASGASLWVVNFALDWLVDCLVGCLPFSPADAPPAPKQLADGGFQNLRESNC
jgi:hypothetical protein